MCNYLHADSSPIPKTGIGYKMFYFYANDTEMKKPLPAFQRTVYRNRLDKSINLTKRYVKWHDEIDGDGFCFFLTLAEAERVVYTMMSNHFIRIAKIRYREGTGKHHAIRMVRSFKPLIALAKEFKILEWIEPIVEPIVEPI